MRRTVDSQPPTPHTGTNYREHVGRNERVKGGNLDARKSLTDQEFARLEGMIIKRRGRAAAHGIVAQTGTAQPCNPRIDFRNIFRCTCCTEGNNEGRMDPVRGQLESP